MSGKDDKKYYKNPEYTNEGLSKEIGGRKRTGPIERRPTGEYDLDPIKGENLNLNLQQRWSLPVQEDESKKKTLHDPRKFEDLMKERSSQSQSADVQKITNSEIESLRVSGIRSISSDVQVKQQVNRLMQNIATAFSGLFVSSKRATMCDNYGHIAPAHWRGDLPKCTECGKQITGQSELRKSSATQRGVDIKPHDNKLEL